MDNNGTLSIKEIGRRARKIKVRGLRREDDSVSPELERIFRRFFQLPVQVVVVSYDLQGNLVVKSTFPLFLG